MPAGFIVLRQRFLQLCRHTPLALRIGNQLPRAVGLGLVDRHEAGPLYEPILRKFLDASLVGC
jgi:hypothetical protein